jgi:hypothetical protein
VQVAGLPAASTLPTHPQGNIHLHNDALSLTIRHRSAVGIWPWLSGLVGLAATIGMVTSGVAMVLLPALMMMVAPVVKLALKRVGVVVVRRHQVECWDESWLSAQWRSWLELEPAGRADLTVEAAQIKDIFVETTQKPHRGWRVQLCIGNGLTQVLLDDVVKQQLAEDVATAIRMRVWVATR